MIILGVDPGLLRTGYGVIDAHDENNIKLLEAGVIRTSSDDLISKRVSIIFNNINDIVKEFKPKVLVLEKLYSHYKHPITSILMGHARGVVCLVCGLNNIKLQSYAATRIKKAVTGNGRAAKVQIQQMVKTLLSLNKLPDPPDISDAIAMAISYVYIEGVGNRK